MYPLFDVIQCNERILTNLRTPLVLSTFSSPIYPPSHDHMNNRGTHGQYRTPLVPIYPHISYVFTLLCTHTHRGAHRQCRTFQCILRSLTTLSYLLTLSSHKLMHTYTHTGEPTDNAVNFNAWMLNTDQTIPNDHLTNLSFTVFGLGNRQYGNC